MNATISGNVGTVDLRQKDDKLVFDAVKLEFSKDVVSAKIQNVILDQYTLDINKEIAIQNGMLEIKIKDLMGALPVTQIDLATIRAFGKTLKVTGVIRDANGGSKAMEAVILVK